jgi:hypothetical protein
MNDETITLTRPQTQNPVASQPSTESKSETKYPTEIIDLPSKGVFYSPDSALSSGTVELKMMTAKEEDILTNQNLIKRGIVLDRLLESLIVNKKVNISDFLLGDKNAIFFASRRLAYGDKYGPLQMKCPSCKESNEITVDLSEIKYKEFDETKYEKGINNFKFILPYAKRTVTYKLLTSGDEIAIENELKALQKIKLNGTSPEVTTRLKYMITSVDGNTDKKFINSFVDNELMSRDSIELRRSIRENTPDVDANFNFVCEQCSHQERVAVPLSVTFFWPEAGR